MNKPLTISLLTLAIAGALGVGYFWGGQQPRTTAVASPAQSERPVLYWYDPMVPDKRFDKPGKSPFMDMQLIPRYADEAQDDGGVTISPRQQQNLGVRTAQAKIRSLDTQISGYGSVTLNERGLRTIVAPSGGIVERLNVNALQQQVKQGETLATLWNPAWSAAQQEYLAVRQLGDRSLTQAARQKLSLLFMPEAVIREVERSGKPQSRVTIVAPASGYVNKLEVRAGMQLTPAQPLFELASLDPVWVEVDYPQAQAAQLTVGSEAIAGSNAWPGKTFRGAISELLPVLDDATRTLKARVVLENPQHQLKPGMYLSVQIAGQKPQPRLMIPQQALLVSGSRNRVLLSEGDGHFVPRNVTVGITQNDWAEITDGLREGDAVVTSGQFLIDSEASLRSSLSQFGDEKPQTSPSEANGQPAGYQTQGVIKAINGDQLTIEHDAVAALNWSPMTMDFTLPADGLPPGIGIGSKVSFRFNMDDNGIHIQRIAPLNAEHGGHQ
ncbi:MULTISPECIES: efflux RND transporter periplasmic adaptor subunit [unclassified Brenneria]|uniref:efflux RND transporter periplasmic adaptor subunit n=1 Tax=unclassified Brenneria TaxID=2634434 RepID=UPI0029C282FE|nr:MULTISPECIES: efflux RND transporter periplasmic adaptor subunit [unclassified Brenneria]MDX5627834.1 efflux RND transporter periplasmic adaptor subunit [Brenneria sp. L3-3Z]MDX5695075.1 efflux RND transporter periplasmic adaptor subunit [Brenneria sp. L4-2C]MEE3660460.1 efflux RND transporter periplasmic adaptor subunit [Brenneria sp. g21c3]